MMKLKPGKVVAPARKDPYDYRRLFETNIVAEFAGTKGDMALLKSAEGQAKIAAAHTKTAEQIGFTLEEAQKENELDDIFRELQYAKPQSGEEELECCEAGSIM
jgi:hypothetical protein